MAADPRDELWEACFETYYDCFFQELLADGLINKWQRLDESTKILVALTASGSAVSGWALWTEPHFRVLWAVVAGVTAILSIGHPTLNVPGRLKDQGDLKRRFAAIRTDLETFRYRMRVNPVFSLVDFLADFADLRRRYSDTVQLIKNDILDTRRFEYRVQDRLDLQLGDEVEKT